MPNKPLSEMTLEECRKEEQEAAAEFGQRIADRDEAQARLDNYLRRRRELTARIIELLEAK